MINIKDYTDEKGRFDSRYLLIRPLSTDGATADVWLSLDLNTVSMADEDKIAMVASMNDAEIDKLGLMVAIKIYRPQNALDVEGEQRFRDEYMIVYNCHHANLIHPTNYSIFKDTPYLVLPYCKRGSSERLIGKRLTNEEAWKYIQDVASGLAYLHAQNPPIVHQDVKPANVLLDDTGNYALTDFGISSQRGGVHGYYFDDENSGTIAYMAPERFLDDTEPMTQSDIWGFGATLCEVLTGRVPFGENGGRAQSKGNAPMPHIPNVSADIQRLIHACLAKEPGDRPTAQQIVAAARAMQYPVKSRRNLKIGLIALALLLVGGLSYIFAIQSRNPVEDAPPPPSLEECYVHGLHLIEEQRDNPDSLKQGLHIIDSLITRRYVPAIFKKATLLSSDTTVRNLLGKDNGRNSRIFDNDAYFLLKLIVQRHDSAYANINATAAYRLGGYHYQENNSDVKHDKNKAYNYFSQAEQWALIATSPQYKKDIHDIDLYDSLIYEIRDLKKSIKDNH